jgi:BirA family biotin operon repressor/biotin-[acetyl-CoA-carboxylase] ligase
MRTGSTNTDLLSRDPQAMPEKPWLLGAQFQQAGRGRAGRSWSNQSGSALMFSCAFDTRLPSSMLPALAPLAGLAACEALREQAGLAGDRLRVKWPNDVLWDDAKLAGILVETRRHSPSVYSVVVGIGINLQDHARLSQELGRPIADWQQIGEKVPIVELVVGIAQAWQVVLREIHQYGFKAFVERFRRLDALVGRQVKVIDQEIVHYQGIAQSVNAQGQLIVSTANGLVPVFGGDISVCPIPYASQ